MQCLTKYKDKIFSGSSDSTIRVWDAITHAHVTTLHGHTDSVNCLAIYQDKLLSGSYSCMKFRYACICRYIRGAA